MLAAVCVLRARGRARWPCASWLHTRVTGMPRVLLARAVLGVDTIKTRTRGCRGFWLPGLAGSLWLPSTCVSDTLPERGSGVPRRWSGSSWRTGHTSRFRGGGGVEPTPSRAPTVGPDFSGGERREGLGAPGILNRVPRGGRRTPPGWRSSPQEPEASTPSHLPPQASSTCPKCHTCPCWCPRHRAPPPRPWTAWPTSPPHPSTSAAGSAAPRCPQVAPPARPGPGPWPLREWPGVSVLPQRTNPGPSWALGLSRSPLVSQGVPPT